MAALRTTNARARRLAMLLILSASAALGAADNSWFARVWQTENGVPDNSVTGVAQTSEGYLWVATHTGLARFDGLRFARIPLPVPSGRVFPLIRSLLRGSNDQLWLALEGGLAVKVTPGATSVFTSTNGLPHFRPLALAQDGDGSVWIGYVNGAACRLAKGQVTRFTARDGLRGTGGCWVATDVQGRLWFAKSGYIGLFRQDQFVTLQTLPEKSLRIAARRAGGMWICAGARVLRYEEGGEPATACTLPVSHGAVEPSVLFEDRDAAVWIGTMGGGLFRYDGTNVVRVETSHSDIQCLTQDREANVWIGTAGGGLDRLRRRVLELQGMETGLPSETVRSVSQDSEGVMWAATGNGGLTRLQNGNWLVLSTNAGWSGEPATCVAPDPKGGIWIGTYRAGLYHWHDRKAASFGRREGLAGGTVRALLPDRAGNLWIALESATCLQRFRDGRFTTFAQPPGSHPIRAMAEDAAGNIWMGTSEGLLLRVEGDKLVDETSRTLTRPKPIRSLCATADGSLWIGYAVAGLGRWHAGNFGCITKEQGLHDDNICGIAADDNGALWLASDRGVFQVRRRELDAVAEGSSARVFSVSYGQDEALPNLQGSYGYSPSAAHSADGRIWFAMRTGLAVTHPDRLQPNRIPPQVFIEEVLVDGHAFNRPGEGAPLRLPPGHRKFELRFSAPVFVAPEGTQFRHQLEHWDAEWVADGTERRADYSRLPPGHYTFRVSACNNAGVWSQKGATLTLAVQPFLWQTWWFRLGGALLVLALLASTIRRYEQRKVRLRLQELERRNAIERERTRIARDIHDDLGAGLAQIGLLADLGASQTANPQQVEATFSKIGARARTAVGALDEIVWAANPGNDSLPRLADYLSRLADDCFEQGPLHCRKAVPTGLPLIPLGAELRHNLALAVKEALTNVLKHSGAKTVWLKLTWDAPILRVSVEDDGEGLKSAAEGDLADGLRNQVARMKDIGGTVDIESTPGQGTRVEFRVKLGVADPLESTN